MNLGDTVQTINAFLPVTGRIVALSNTYQRVMIKDFDTFASVSYTHLTLPTIQPV